MDSIGVREARQNLSTYLERVKAGESLTITEHGKPVAVISPPLPEDPWEALVAAGTMTPAKRRFTPRQLPKPEPGMPLLSEILAQMRDEESF